MVNKEKYGFRKSKVAKTLCGAVLGTITVLSLSNVASADEISDTKVDSFVVNEQLENVSPKSSSDKATVESKVEEQANKPLVDAKDQEGLDKNYSELKEEAKRLDVQTTEGAPVEHKELSKANEDLKKQQEDIRNLAKGRDEANKNLQTAVEKAKEAGVSIVFGDKVNYSNLDKLNEDTQKQVDGLNALSQSVIEAKATLEKAVEEAKAAGVMFEGTSNIDIAKGEDLKAKIAEAENALKALTTKQNNLSAEFDKLVAEFKVKGVPVKVSGTTVVEAKDAEEALKAVKEKLEAAKAEADKIKSANEKIVEKNRSAKAVLTKDSTAKLIGEVYTQTVSAKAEIAGLTGKASVIADSSVELINAELLSPSGKKQTFVVKGGKVDESITFSEAGDYVLNYSFKAKENKDGSIKSNLTINGKESLTKSGMSVFDFVAKVNSSKKEIAKRKIILFLDRSSSFADPAGQNYIDTIANSIVDSMNPGDEMAVVGNINTIDFLAPGQMINFQPLTSDKAALKAAIAMKGDNGTASANPVAMEAARKVIGDNGTENLQAFLAKKDIAELFGNGSKANELTLVNLLDDTAIDVPTSTTLGQIERFVKAGGNVLSYVPNVTKGQVDATERLMKQVGVKAENVESVDYNKGNPKVVADKIVKSINTKTVIEVVVKPNGQVLVSAEKGLTLTSVKLAGPDGKTIDLPIKDGKASYDGKLEDGKYTVTFSYNGNGTVTGTALIDGKEVAKKSDGLKSEAPVKEVKTSKNDKFKAVPLDNTLPPKEITEVATIVIKTTEPKINKVETEVHEISVSKEVHPVKIAAKPAIKTLPKTGEEVTSTIALGTVLTGVAIGLFGLKKKEEN